MKTKTREDLPLPLSLSHAVREAYNRGEEDEALEPVVKALPSGQPVGRIRSGDSVIFYDLRGEREIELTQSLIDQEFSHFPRKEPLSLRFVTMIEYSPSLHVRVAFPPQTQIKNTLAEVVTCAGLSLAKIAESEKAIHIGYFMNGKTEQVFKGEERFIIPSPHGVASYAEKPEMSVRLVAEKVSSHLEDPHVTLLIANFANVDVVGHIEDKRAVLAAVEAVDGALGTIAEACRKKGVTLVITSDHGTVEEWLYADGTVNTGHTKNPVPFILADYGRRKERQTGLRGSGELADVAPTILDLLNLDKPAEMTGQSLIINPDRGETPKRKILLLILDGWGAREELQGNLIKEARTPHFDRLWEEFPHSLLQAAGEAVGMPSRTVGNSEAGHLHLGAGRRILLDRVRIDRAIEDGSFSRNEAFLWAMGEAKKQDKALHLMGIVSHYSSHGTIRHIPPLLQMASKQDLRQVYIHSFIGRRGERPESGAIYLEKVAEMARTVGVGEVVTVLGRHWSLDREGNWDRIEKAYRALVYGEGTKVTG